MYLKLALRNARRSIGDYLLYITAITILSAIMTVSSCISITGKMQAGFQTAALPLLIALILIILTGYINSFMLKQRAKEFANYLLLGMEKSKLSRMFFTEFLVIGLMCLVLGSVIGSGIYYVLYALVFQAIQNSVLNFSYILQGIIQTFLYVFAAIFLSALCVKRNINKLQIRELMIEEKRNQNLGNNQQVRIWGILFVISFLCLIGQIFCIAYLTEDFIAVMISTIAIPLLFTIFAFYKWMFLLIGMIRQRQPESLYQNNRLYMITQMTAGIKANAVINGVFCTSLIFSAASFVCGMIMLQPETVIFDAENQRWMGFLQISISIVFIVLYFSILSLQQIIEMKREATSFLILRYIGKTGEQIKALLKVQIFIKLSLPAVMCFFLLLIAAPLMNYRLNIWMPFALKNVLLQSLGLFAASFLTLHTCFFITVYNTAVRFLKY